MVIFLLDMNMSDSLGQFVVVRKGGAVVGMEGGTLHRYAPTIYFRIYFTSKVKALLQSINRTLIKSTVNICIA